METIKEGGNNWFAEARFGLFVHYGLYSLLARAEWAWNREQIPAEEYRELACRFDAAEFDAGALCDLAVDAGMTYVVLTTMHHEGFRLYPTDLSDFHIGNSAARGRDLVAEMVAAARSRSLKVGLYHSLNNWADQPDGAAALEREDYRKSFVEAAHRRLAELVTRYRPIDIVWYDGWWPFDADGWRAEEMNSMLRALCPGVLFNGRNGLPGDFATPEGHLSAPNPWRPWEACMTLNNSWGYHKGDKDWKSVGAVIDMLAICAQGRGNLLLNIGPEGSGRVPASSAEILREVGAWIRRNRACLWGTELFTFDLRERGTHRGDWNLHGPMTCCGNDLYWLIRRWPGNNVALGGLDAGVEAVSFLDGGAPILFHQTGTRLELNGLPEIPPDESCTVIKITCDRPPVMYQTGSLTVPLVAHPHYDPCPSDIIH